MNIDFYKLFFALSITWMGISKLYAQHQTNPIFISANYNREEYIMNHILYPIKAIKAKKEGVVTVTFNVDTNGIISNVEAKNHIGYGLSKEAVRVIKSMPKWEIKNNPDGETKVGINEYKVHFVLSQIDQQTPLGAYTPNPPQCIDKWLLGRKRIVSEYFEDAAHKGLENGTVMIEYIIDEKGKIISPKVAYSTDTIFNKYALEYVSNFYDLWSAAKNKDGIPIKCRQYSVMYFHVDSKPPSYFLSSNDSEIKSFGPPPPPPEEPIRFAAVMPKPTFDLNKYISDNIQYPPQAIKNEIQGTVIIEFIVNLDGSVSGIKPLRELGGGISEEAVRIIKSMPKWSPALDSHGHPVRCFYKIPVSFQLSEK